LALFFLAATGGVSDAASTTSVGEIAGGEATGPSGSCASTSSSLLSTKFSASFVSVRVAAAAVVVVAVLLALLLPPPPMAFKITCRVFSKSSSLGTAYNADVVVEQAAEVWNIGLLLKMLLCTLHADDDDDDDDNSDDDDDDDDDDHGLAVDEDGDDDDDVVVTIKPSVVVVLCFVLVPVNVSAPRTALNNNA
jgi:hypothetical protein